jgi:glycine cleavage system aminomethyltransferase T
MMTLTLFLAVEHMAVREDLGIYNLCSVANFIMEGKDAVSVL